MILLVTNKRKAGLVLAGVLTAGAVLFIFPPGEFGFYPRCLLYSLTGWQCPGCGGLRAAHQLLHGHIIAAFHFNPLLVALLPLAGWLFVSWLVTRWSGRDWLKPWRNPFCWWVLVAIVIAFSVARNLT